MGGDLSSLLMIRANQNVLQKVSLAFSVGEQRHYDVGATG